MSSPPPESVSPKEEAHEFNVLERLLRILSVEADPENSTLSKLRENLHTLRLLHDKQLKYYYLGHPPDEQLDEKRKLLALLGIEDCLLELKNVLPDEVAKACVAVLDAYNGPRAVYMVFPVPSSQTDNEIEGKVVRPFCIECPAKLESVVEVDLESEPSKEKASEAESHLRPFFEGEQSGSRLSEDVQSILTMFSDLPAHSPTDPETLANLRTWAEDWKDVKKSFHRFADPALMFVVKDSNNPNNDRKTFFKPGRPGRVMDELTGYVMSLDPREDATTCTDHGMVLLHELSSFGEVTWSKAKSDLVNSLAETKDCSGDIERYVESLRAMR